MHFLINTKLLDLYMDLNWLFVKNLYSVNKEHHLSKGYYNKF